jgi:hypothetical protein
MIYGLSLIGSNLSNIKIFIEKTNKAIMLYLDCTLFLGKNDIADKIKLIQGKIHCWKS